jgi:prophage antirepressor-like protein
MAKSICRYGVPFQYEGHQIRWGGTKEEPWFVAQDVCSILGIKEPSSALRDFLDTEKGMQAVHTLGGKQELLVVYEAGLYQLLFRSNKPEAVAFRRWVCHEVLPSIRKTGEYRSKRREKYVQLGLSPEWIEQREQGIEVRKDFTGTLQEHGVKKGFEYGTCTNAIYLPVLGGTAANVRKERQLPAKGNLRDNLSLKEILQISLSEVVAQEKIEDENRQGLSQCFNACKEAGTAIAAASKTNRQIK